MTPDEIDDTPRCDGRDGGCEQEATVSCPLCGGVWCGDCWDGIGWKHLHDERKATRQAFLVAAQRESFAESDEMIVAAFEAIRDRLMAHSDWGSLEHLVRMRWQETSWPWPLSRALLAEHRWQRLEGISRTAPLRAGWWRLCEAWWRVMQDELNVLLRRVSRKGHFARDLHVAITRPRSAPGNRSPVASSAYDEVTLS